MKKQDFINSKMSLVGILIIGIFAMSFINTGKQTSPVQGPLLTDTVPKKNNIDVHIDKKDMEKIMKELNMQLSSVSKALEDIDWNKISGEITDAVKKIDMEKIKKEIDLAIKGVDWKKINEEVRNSLKDIDVEKIREEINQSLKDIKININMEELNRNLEEIKKINKKELEKELKKTMKEIEKNKKEIRKDIEKMKKDLESKDDTSEVIDQEAGRDGLILI